MEHFSPFGEISEVHLVVDRETKRSKGVAYILYQVPEHAARYYTRQHVALWFFFWVSPGLSAWFSRGGIMLMFTW